MRHVTADQSLPHLLTPLSDLPEDLNHKLRTMVQMNRKGDFIEIPFIETYGIAIGPHGEVGLYALGKAVPTGGQELWPIGKIAMASAPQADWLTQLHELGRVIIGTYTDIFLAALVAEHDEQLGPAQEKRFRETTSFGVVQAFTIKPPAS